MSLARGPRLRIVLADDHPYYREGLADLLREQGIDVVRDVANGEAAVRAVDELGPDVVLMDLSMPGTSGLEAIRRLVELGPDTRILVLTVSQDEEDILHAVLAGACGYVTKDRPVEEIVAGITAAAAGESHISPRIAPLLLRHARAQDDTPPSARLSDRELDVLSLLAEGDHSDEIANRLGVPPATVREHLANILFKLQIKDRAQTAVNAVRDRIV